MRITSRKEVERICRKHEVCRSGKRSLATVTSIAGKQVLIWMDCAFGTLATIGFCSIKIDAAHTNPLPVVGGQRIVDSAIRSNA